MRFEFSHLTRTLYANEAGGGISLPLHRKVQR